MGLFRKNEKMVPVTFEKWEDVGGMLVSTINVIGEVIQAEDNKVTSLGIGLMLAGIGGLILTSQVVTLQDQIDILYARVKDLESKLMKKDEEELKSSKGE